MEASLIEKATQSVDRTNHVDLDEGMQENGVVASGREATSGHRVAVLDRISPA
jgi:hypothetical protein